MGQEDHNQSSEGREQELQTYTFPPTSTDRSLFILSEETMAPVQEKQTVPRAETAAAVLAVQVVDSEPEPWYRRKLRGPRLCQGKK